jgi:hypothetical protein
MPAPTPAYVKNMIHRSLREIIDPSPTKEDKEKDMSLRADYIVPKGSNLLYGDFNHITGVHAANS